MKDEDNFQFFNENEARINNIVSSFFVWTIFVGPAMMLGRFLNIFQYVSYKLLILCSIYMPVSYFLMRALCKYKKYCKFTKYFCLISMEISVLFLSVQNGLCLFISYIFVSVISCLYYTPKFTIKINLFCYVGMLISLFIRSRYSSFTLFSHVIQGRKWFLAFAMGDTIEFFLCTIITYHVSKVTKSTLVTQLLQEEKIKRIQEKLVSGFANLVESKDFTTGEHIKNTSKYVRMICYRLKEMGAYTDELTEQRIQYMIKAAPLHDLGKISIPESILCKPGKLDPAEIQEMQKHPLVGSKLIDKNLSDIEDKEYTETAALMALCHHEWWNGNGYPLHLVGAEIPLCARIMAVADVLDALRCVRPYKRSLSLDETLTIMESLSGKQFDSVIIDALLSLKEKLA